MKLIKYVVISVILLLIVSCKSVSVVADYDTKADFSSYKTFAFYKKGIDKSKISDLDKKRIMRAVQSELKVKGMTISEKPDVLISLFAKSREQVDMNDHFYGGFFYPVYYRNPYYLSSYTEGTLFIDILDAKKRDMIWQGVGRGALTNSSTKRKEERINEFVKEIMENYPPKSDKK